MYDPPEKRDTPQFADLFPPAKMQVKRRKRATPEEIQAIRADYLAGLSQSELSKKYGYNGNSICNHYRDLVDAPVPPCPPQEPGEPSIDYARRCWSWKCQHDRAFNVERRRKARKGARKSTVVRKATPQAAAPPPPADAVAPAPVERVTVWRRVAGWFGL